MPNEIPNVLGVPPAWMARQNTQFMLGQIHGLLWFAESDLDSWFIRMRHGNPER